MVNSKTKKMLKRKLPVDNDSPFQIGGAAIATILEMYWYTSHTERLSELVSIVTDLEYLVEFIKSTSQYRKQFNEIKKLPIKKIKKNGKLKSKGRQSRARISQ